MTTFDAITELSEQNKILLDDLRKSEQFALERGELILEERKEAKIKYARLQARLTACQSVSRLLTSTNERLRVEIAKLREGVS